MLRKLICIAFFFLAAYYALWAQQTNTVIASNFEAKHQLIELTLDPSVEGTVFTIAIVKNKVGTPKNFTAKAGKFYYDLKDIDSWKGHIDYVVTNLPANVIRSKRLVGTATISNKWTEFLKTTKLSLRTINYSETKSFSKIPFTLILLGLIALFSTLFFFIGKKKALTAILIGVLLSVLIVDAREMMDRWTIAQNVEKTYPKVSPHSYVHGFLAAARPLMEGGAWTFRGKFKDEYFKLCIKYKLADLYYYPERLKRIVPPPGTFVITQQPPLSSDEVLVKENGFYLIKLL